MRRVVASCFVVCVSLLAVGGAAGERPPPRVRYVALGDSVSAGEGLPRLAGPAGEVCHRSGQAYPSILARQPPFRAQTGSRYLNLSCSGATTEDVLFRRQKGPDGGSVPPQLEELRKARPTFVTLTIGLDDLHFDTIVRACLTPSSITPTGLARWTRACQSRQTSIRRRLTLVGTNLRRILLRILALRPAPQVFVTGYYDPWPAPTDISRCSETHKDLSSIAFALATENGNVAALIRWERRFDALLERTAHSAGAKFVPLEQAFVGHELCSQSEWVIFPSRANQKNFSALHPTRAGQQRLAALIRAAASNEASPS